MAASIAVLLLSLGMATVHSITIGMRGPFFWGSLAVFVASFARVMMLAACWRNIRAQGWRIPLATFIFRYELLPRRALARIPPKSDCESLPCFDEWRDDMANLCDVLESMQGARSDMVVVWRSPKRDVAMLARYVLKQEGLTVTSIDEERSSEGESTVHAVSVPRPDSERALEALAKRMR